MENEFEELLVKLSREHEKLFPDATTSSQAEKLEEELNELDKSKGSYEAINELADCFIVCAGLYRFVPQTALLTMSGISNTVEELGYKEVFLKCVEAKWEFNKTRKWEVKDGYYHHIGEDSYD